ncbi:MAG: hypothetical protein ACHQUA_02735, partial [Microgenomates group bacterium]
YKLYKGGKKELNIKNPLVIILLFLITGWLATFMAHSRSTFIWQHLKTLKFVQFPWRFLTLSTLSFSFISGAVVLFVNKKYVNWTVGGLAVLVMALNWNYFLPEHGRMGPLTDEAKFSGAAWDLQRTAGIFDYLPVTAKENPKEPPKTLAEAIKGKGKISNEYQGTKWAKFDAEVDSDEMVVRMGIFSFPNWKAYIDGNEAKAYIDKDEKWGRMYLNIPKGKHGIEFKLFSTPVRTISNVVSLVSWTILLFVIYQSKLQRKVKSR